MVAQGLREGHAPPLQTAANAWPNKMDGRNRPTVVLYVPHHPGNSRVSGAKKPCRGGFHIRPGCLRRREPGRYRIGPYIEGYAAADRENRRPRVTSPSVGDDARIVPGGLWWRRVCGRGMPLPYKPRQTPGQTKWTAATAPAAVGRDALIPPHPAAAGVSPVLNFNGAAGVNARPTVQP